MQHGKMYTLVYALILGTVCALLIAGTGELTAPHRAANAKADRIRNILAVLEIRTSAETSAEQLLAIFEDQVESVQHHGMERYRVKASGAVAVPFSGSGLWGPVKGFLALEPDMETIRGISFYEQSETPGLGGEIAADWFREQFKGKSITSEGGQSGIRIVRDGAAAQHEVDAISGATMTGEKVQFMLNETIRQIIDEVNNG